MATSLIILHYHLRPGGIRRIIEQATPWLVQRALDGVSRVVMLCGEAEDKVWNDRFRKLLGRVPVEFHVHPPVGYLDGQGMAPSHIQHLIQKALEQALEALPAGEEVVLWAHNLGVGRNILLTKVVGEVCQQAGILFLSHHHDWWFDNRWQRWAQIRAAGIQSLQAVAKDMFPLNGGVCHISINGADAAIFEKWIPQQTQWIPNLTTFEEGVSEERVARARRWLQREVGVGDDPVWFFPSRILRRKNLAEAILLTRWLRPGGWLVVSGTPSSMDETPYASTLEALARELGWKVRMGVLARSHSVPPSIPELIAASEAVLLTSIQEGFGLAYLEPVRLGRPLLARRLPNVVPDLERFGLRFPCLYEDLWIPPSLFDWDAERLRQRTFYQLWRKQMPQRCRAWCGKPPVLSHRWPIPVPFSRLTLTGQIEVLRVDPERSFREALPLNPWLAEWRDRAESGRLPIASWPESADRWLSGPAYAERFREALERARTRSEDYSPEVAVQLLECFIQDRLQSQNIYPLLWAKQT